MRQNRVKKLMREGKLALGKYVSLADPQVVEIIGIAGFDAAFIDMEHTGFDLRTSRGDDTRIRPRGRYLDGARP